MARRAAEMASAGNASADLMQFLSDGFTSAAMAKVGTSAIESEEARLPARERRRSSPHKDELLHVASAAGEGDARERLSAAAAQTTFPVAGRNAIATIKVQLVNMRDGGFISEHDFHIASLIADVVCGGDVDAGIAGHEEYLMALERKRFCAPARPPEDAGTDHGHAADRQAGPQLRTRT